MLEVVDERLGSDTIPVDAELAAQMSAIKGASVLVVEDSKINQQIALELLSQADINASFAENGMEAIALVEQQSFDVVLMDLQMPVMDGFEATQILRVLYDKDDLPIVAMTADSRAHDRQKCLDIGMNDHCVKSVQPEDLYSVLVKWIKPQNSEMVFNGSDVPEPADNSLEDVIGIDLTIGMNSVNGNNVLLKKLLIEFHDDHFDDANRVRQALAEGDWVTAQRIAHTLMSTSGSLGAKGINEMAQKLDEAVRAEKSESYEGILAWLEMALLPTMESLKTLKASANEDKNKIRKQGPEDREKILQLIEKLARMLNSMSADAEAVAKELHQEFNDDDLRQLSSQLIDELSLFDFDAAGLTLDKLVTAIEKVSH